jgi:hypothetical protein
MRKILAVLLLLATPLFAASRFYFTAGTATGANATVTFSDTLGAFNARSICVFNDDTAASLYVSVKQAAATTSSSEIKFGDKWRCWKFDSIAGGDGWARVDLITGGGSIAYRVDAMR